ncbi:MAG: HIT family protein [Acidimicrobiaceae bacterium]|nr:HIT family protein [Acidimicrobiaceae bacterium]MXV87982.1 HIT family protein [Acidimicrobiales bacterium]MCY3608615.1 HIT family protein [Acidimicrobiaceae bacterium]MCY3892151.1 HIT family protein [Acidimicrobiaceae bacterium]MCY3950077.1 HIT family protein [Acidimicrobiaceae bacterium]
MANSAANDPPAAGRMPGCTFCSIVAGDIPALRIYEDDHAVAFMDRLPMTVGHCLVIPRRHVTDIWELTDDDAAHVMQAARRVASLVRERLKPAGVNLLNNNGAAADQTQFHFHIHVIPRYGRDRLLHPWERIFAPAGEIESAYRLLSAPSSQAPAAATPNN